MFLGVTFFFFLFSRQKEFFFWEKNFRQTKLNKNGCCDIVEISYNKIICATWLCSLRHSFLSFFFSFFQTKFISIARKQLIWMISWWKTKTKFYRLRVSKVGNNSQGRPEGSLFNRCRGGRYTFALIASLYPWYIPHIAECQAKRYQVPFLKIFGMTRPGIEHISTAA